MLSDRVRNLQSKFYVLPSIHFCSLRRHFLLTIIHSRQVPADAWLAHAQAVDTRPTSLTIVRPGIEAKTIVTSSVVMASTCCTFLLLLLTLC